MSNGTTEQLDNIQAWPLLVSEVDGYTTSGGGGTTAGGSLNAVVERSLRGILGWRPRKSDPKGLLAALNQSFSLKPADGRDTWTWTPHSYHVPADAGAVTGAQASLYKMAKVAWEQSRPLLDGIRPLCDEPCVSDVEALRAIVTSEFSELVSEFGYVGGPRVQRVDTLFDSLLGEDETNIDPNGVEGHMELLGLALGLDPVNVNTIEDEQNLTNYLILVGYALSVRQNWESMANSLHRLPGGEVYLGTQTTRLSWELAALGESAHQLGSVLESMFVGEGERKTITLDLADAPMTVDEIAHWAEYVATEEGPRLMREGGKAGIRALERTLLQLGEVLAEAFEISNAPSDNPIPQVHSARARSAFNELKTHAYQAWALANRLSNPGGVLVAPGKPRMAVLFSKHAILPMPSINPIKNARDASKSVGALSKARIQNQKQIALLTKQSAALRTRASLPGATVTRKEAMQLAAELNTAKLKELELDRVWAVLERAQNVAKAAIK